MKNMYVLYLLNEKTRNSFCLVRLSARNQGFLLIITGRGESGKVILEVRTAVFAGAVETFFGQRPTMAQPPWKKWPVRLCRHVALLLAH